MENNIMRYQKFKNNKPFKGFKINWKERDDTLRILNTSNLNKILSLASYCSQKYTNPIAGEFCIFHKGMNHKTLIERIKNHLKDIKFNYIYSIEQTESQKKKSIFHTHLYLILDISDIDATNYFDVNSELANKMRDITNVITDYTDLNQKSPIQQRYLIL